MSNQVSASGNLDLWTAGACSTNDYDTLSHAIMRTACIAATRANLSGVCSFYTLFYYYINYLYYYTHYFKTRNSDLGAYSLQKTGQQAHPQLGHSSSE